MYIYRDIKMGVRKLNKFLISRKLTIYHPDLHNFVGSRPHNTKNKVIAIDFWLYAHKFLHSARYTNILLGFWNQIMRFLSCGIVPLYVMDGIVPIEKQETVDMRNKKRNNIINRIKEIDRQKDVFINLNELNELNDIKENLQKKVKRVRTSELNNIHRMFDHMGIPYVRANYEADAMCAKLYKEGIIIACLSDDMDMLALGCGSTIKFYQGNVIEYNLAHINRELNITQEQLIDMCILFGTDYLRHPFHLEGEIIHSMIREHGSILEFLQSHQHPTFNMDNPNIRIIGENYQTVRDIYMNSVIREIIPVNLYNYSIEYISPNKLINFFSKIRGPYDNRFAKKINDDINMINQMIENNAFAINRSL